MNIHAWIGQSGRQYIFDIYPPRCEVVPNLAGVYIFCKVQPAGFLLSSFAPLYVGQTENLHTRLRSHEKWEPAHISGMTHLHILTAFSEEERLHIESDLIGSLAPPLNIQQNKFAHIFLRERFPSTRRNALLADILRERRD